MGHGNLVRPRRQPESHPVTLRGAAGAERTSRAQVANLDAGIANGRSRSVQHIPSELPRRKSHVRGQRRESAELASVQPATGPRSDAHASSGSEKAAACTTCIPTDVRVSRISRLSCKQRCTSQISRKILHLKLLWQKQLPLQNPNRHIHLRQRNVAIAFLRKRRARVQKHK